MQVPPIIAEERLRHAKRTRNIVTASLPFLCAGLAALAWVCGRTGSVLCLLYVAFAMFGLFITILSLVFLRPFISWSKVVQIACLLVLTWFGIEHILGRLALSGFCKRLDATVTPENLRSWAEPLASSSPTDRDISIDKQNVPNFVVEMMGNNTPYVFARRNKVVIASGGRAGLIVRIYFSECSTDSPSRGEVMWRPGVFVEIAGG